ncbi:ATP-binding cassette domain-containing protein [Commensalibacter papalotli (ex Botero et al. 2024)]|uniref:ATPase component (FetA) n=1 Tax=Commensalibacter papalotli (ex Botero et al. 2024) TaxID=2972766 RepID=A0ABN8W394_9PROT|nr:ABC transporter ATP-binding protein [Commensalibacter papalotli (ex Botero et al. 2024)]CAI3922627.1 ABC-type iron transporter FetAB [Commensalibacter papalotli (ex Botero et al. 2024)]CAI3929490.1 ABC-type iron transporter FetAB [Commensalibacter papalotli (ex Botero et al. 2024)]
MIEASKDSVLSIKKISALDQGPYSLEVASGDCIVITGESGVGKSVFLRMIADLIPNQGQVFLDDKERNFFPAPEWRKRVTYIAAESGWWAQTVKEHFANLDLVRYWLPKFNLKETLLDADILQLSTGEKQRMALLRAISAKVRFLLLDEITSALDPKTVLVVEKCVQELQQQNIGTLLVSHNMEQVQRLATKHYQLRTDQLVICE